MLTAAAPPPPVVVHYAPGVDLQTAPFGTVVTFRGTGWRPHGRIVASYDGSCGPLPPDTACGATGELRAFRADGRGRFTFRFRIGAQPPPGPQPKAAGDGEVSFSGRRPGGRPATRLGVRRPRPATTRQRAEATAIRRAFAQLARSIRANAPQTQKALDADERASSACQDVLDPGGPAARQDVIGADISANADALTIGTDAAAFAAFARRLEAVRPTDPELRPGVAQWLASLRAPRHVPTPSLCDELRAWRDTGWDPARAPIAADATRPQDELAASRSVGQAALRLVELGASRQRGRDFRGSILGLENFITKI